MQKGLKRVLSLVLSVLMLVPCIAVGFTVSAADIDRSALDEVIAQAEAVNADDYVDVSALTAAIESAKSAEFVTQTEADNMTAAVAIELLKLEKKNTASKVSGTAYSNIEGWSVTQLGGYNATSAKSASDGNMTNPDTVHSYDGNWHWGFVFGKTFESVFKNAYAQYSIDRYTTTKLDDLGNISSWMIALVANGGHDHVYRLTGTKQSGGSGTEQDAVSVGTKGTEIHFRTNFSTLFSCRQGGMHGHTDNTPYIATAYTPIKGDVPAAGESVQVMSYSQSNVPTNQNGLVYGHCMSFGFQFDAYDTTALREAIALSVEAKSHYAPLSYSVYLSALENAMNVLNTPVTVKVNEDDTANYEDIAAAQAAIDTATQRLVNAYNALDKDFVIEYYSDDVLVNSQTVLYVDSYTTNLISDIPEKTGYTFTAWADKDANTYTSDAFASSLAPANGGKVRLDAQFDINEYTVTFINYNGDVLYSTTVKYNENVEYAGVEPIKPDEGETGYTFVGWDKDIDAPITENTVFTAQFDSHIHSYTELVEIIKEANCAEKGLALYMCHCGRTSDIELPIAPNNHDLIHHEAKAATCTESGWYEYDTCSRCDYTTYTVIGTIAHTPGDVVIENKVDADCVNSGSYDEVVYCTACNTEISREHKTIDALGHDIEHHDALAATCSSTGHNAYDTCTRCDYTTFEATPIDANAHKYGEWIIDGEADCLTGGTKHRVCEYNAEHIETADIPATGEHSFDDGVVTVAPTCSAEGVITYTCTVCSTTKTESIAIDPDAHDYGEFITVTPATCTKNGEMRKVCKHNDSHYISEVIPASGHDIIHHEAKDSTCTAEGYKAYDTCSKCDYTTYQKINKLGHKFVLSAHKDSTCAQKGYDLFKCSRCDATKKTELALKEHSWDNGVVTKEPTVDNPGEKTYTCTVCMATKVVKLYACSHCDEIFEGDEAYNKHVSEVGKICPYCGHKHDQYFEHMTFIKLKCFLTRLFKLLFGFFGSFKK